MKLLFLSLMIINLGQINAFANDRLIIDDLQSIETRVDEKVLHANIHYPNYRMGGGTPPTRPILDCLVLDILDSDIKPTLDLKKRITEEILVVEGFGTDMENKVELLPAIKGDNIIFKLQKGHLFVTTITVTTKNGNNFSKVFDKIMPHRHLSNRPAAVNLLYVRDCRL